MTQLELPFDFPHKPPSGYYYECETFKRNVIRIWIYNTAIFTYTSNPVCSIWGFYNTQQKTYSAPINSSKCGDTVNIKDTTPYSAMQINFNPLEKVLYV